MFFSGLRSEVEKRWPPKTMGSPMGHSKWFWEEYTWNNYRLGSLARCSNLKLEMGVEINPQISSSVTTFGLVFLGKYHSMQEKHWLPKLSWESRVKCLCPRRVPGFLPWLYSLVALFCDTEKVLCGYGNRAAVNTRSISFPVSFSVETQTILNSSRCSTGHQNKLHLNISLWSAEFLKKSISRLVCPYISQWLIGISPPPSETCTAPQSHHHYSSSSKKVLLYQILLDFSWFCEAFYPGHATQRLIKSKCTFWVSWSQ